MCQMTVMICFDCLGCRHRTEACAGRRRGGPGYRRRHPHRSTSSSNQRRRGGHSAPPLHQEGLPGSAHQLQHWQPHHQPRRPRAAPRPRRRRLPRWHGGSSPPPCTRRRPCTCSPTAQLGDGDGESYRWLVSRHSSSWWELVTCNLNFGAIWAYENIVVQHAYLQ